ncbi:MAG: hypothetical protein NTY50_05050 [Methylobacter sp.]|nr:hypothetical protein [Methylobacter sp.]
MNEPLRTKEEENKITEFYSERLKFLWEQYNKIIGFGILLSGITLILLVSVILNSETREIIKTICDNDKGNCLNPFFIKTAILTLFISTVCFIGCRWCSQILMERQIYGKADDALYYFENILENETVLPSALTPKKYTPQPVGERSGLLRMVGNLNELAKWTGVLLTIVGWISTLCYLFPLLDI